MSNETFMPSNPSETSWEEALAGLPEPKKKEDEVAKLRRDISEGVRLVKRWESAETSLDESKVLGDLSQWARGCGWSHTPDDIMERTTKDNDQLGNDILETS